MVRILSFVLVAIGLLGGVEQAAAAARDVVDRETLKNFVLEAKSLLESAQDEAARAAILETFRTDEGWRHGSIYIFITSYDGVGFFHATQPEREGVNNIDSEDSNGVKITQQNIAAAQAGGGFTEYLFDNPAIAGEDESTKVSYVAPIEIEGASYYIGAGLYLTEDQTNVAPISWGSLKGQV
ncbi:MAG: hypothetical protein F4Y91_16255 [Gemmatimonadetes bacterium]|nr:hypothetical protein [Gemmatimonadota bacterium]MYB68588.1 hypothetical protein [Gemmatimonadota bacterium]